MKHYLIIIMQLAMAVYLSAAPVKDITEYRKLRQQALEKPRAVIYNNDGCDSYVYPRSGLPFTIEKFLQQRTSPLVNTDITTISYCTISSSFGQFTHNTKVGEFLLNTHQRQGRINVTPEFAKLKTDPLHEVIKFAHANNLEVFWSNRVNDTHDYGHRPDKPYERWSKLKQAHPELLMGKCGERLPNGRWSAVDFTHPEIRELAVKYLTEVCENYAVDGIELDFFRHLYLFKSVAKGGTASPRELEMLTDMMRKIRAMTERIGMERGRPILVAIRIPDSEAYCREIGIDLKEWLKDGLVDIVIGSGYFRLNDWEYLVKLGHKYNIKVYAGLSESRITKLHPLLQRNSKLTYRARAAAALQAGVDGIYLFNQFSVSSPKMGYIREIGDSGKLAKTNKLYFVTYRDGSPNRDVKNGRRHQKIEILTPGNAASLAAGPINFPLHTGDESQAESASLILYGEPLIPEALSVTFNGTPLKFNHSDQGLLYYTVPVKLIRAGKNTVSLSASQTSNSAFSATIMKGNVKLSGRQQGLWRRLFSGTPRVEEIVDGSYLLGDLGTGDNIYNLIYSWSAAPAGKTAIAFTAKVKSSDSPDAVCVRVSNGKYAEYLRLEPDKISLKYAGASCKINTTSKFHKYKIELDKSKILVYVDGKLSLTGRLETSYKADANVFSQASFHTPYMALNSVIIGSLSGPGKGEAYWKDVQLISSSPTLKDLALLVVNNPREPDLRPFAQAKPLTVEYPQLNSADWQTVVEYNAADGKLPASPWKKRSYTANAQVEAGELRLDHTPGGKLEYCYYEYRFPGNRNARFTEVLFTLELKDKTNKSQFNLVVSRPTENGKIIIWAFRFATNGIIYRQGSSDATASFPIDNKFHDYRVICDSRNGIAELYIDASHRPLVSTSGRITDKYACGVKFGDASGSVKGKVALKNIIIKELEVLK